MKNVLFVCDGNSARSIMAEAILNREGRGRFQAYSGGSQPVGTVNPLVLEYLRSQGLSAEGARSKDWHEFAGEDAPPLDFVFLLCDEAAREKLPAFAGKPMTAHWGVEDPAPYWDQPEKARHLVREAFHALHRRISLFTNLPLEKLDKLALQQRLEAIGETA